MFAKQAFVALAPCERRPLWSQWQWSGKCARCFHTSQQRLAEDIKISKVTSGNAHKRGPNRQERAAMISKEVSRLQQGAKPAGAETGRRHAANTNFRARGPRTATPDTIQRPYTERRSSVAAGRNPTREGPQNRGVGRIPRADDRQTQNTSRFARGTRTPYSAIENPAVGGATGLSESRAKISASKPHNPSLLNAKQLLESGFGTHTPAARQPTGLVADRLALLNKGSFIDNESQPLTTTLREGKNPRPSSDCTFTRPELAILTKDFFPNASKTIAQRLVTGQYDSKNILERSESKRTAIPAALENAVRTTMMNPSYLSSDSQKFLAKVVELLPQSASKGKSTREFLEYLTPPKEEPIPDALPQ